MRPRPRGPMTRTAQRPRRASAPSSAEPRKSQPLLVAYYWGAHHCVIPDGFRMGQPFVPYDWQKQYLLNYYLVRGDAEWAPQNPLLRTAFVYRMGLVVGPVLFAGWAQPGDLYECHKYGCRCGWTYAYDEGEPKGMPWSTPLIQITAVSEDATQNTYDALRPMIEQGPLADLIPKTGEEFIRLPGGGRIDTVTSSSRSRLGNPVTFAPQDEAGLYTPETGMVKLARTQYRGLSGMSGRASLTTNAWDPAQKSVAQTEYESGAADVYRQFPQ